MARPSRILIEALRSTVARLTAGSAYQWGHHGQCNCGHLAQTVCKLPPARIHSYALERAGDWEALANAYCPTSGYPIDDVITELVAIGLTTDDLAHLEKLDDPAVLAALPEVTSCNCSICRRLGTLWAYYATDDVRVIGATATYRWGDKTIDFHHCASCGCATHWSPLPHRDEPDRMGINARLLAPEVLAAARVRRLDGASDNWAYLDD